MCDQSGSSGGSYGGSYGSYGGYSPSYSPYSSPYQSFSSPYSFSPYGSQSFGSFMPPQSYGQQPMMGRPMDVSYLNKSLFFPQGGGTQGGGTPPGGGTTPGGTTPGAGTTPGGGTPPPTGGTTPTPSPGMPPIPSGGLGTPAPQYGPGVFMGSDGIPRTSDGSPLLSFQGDHPELFPQSNGQPGQPIPQQPFGFGNGSIVPLSPVIAGQLGLTNNGQGKYVNSRGQIAGLVQ